MIPEWHRGSRARWRLACKLQLPAANLCCCGSITTPDMAWAAPSLNGSFCTLTSGALSSGNLEWPSFSHQSDDCPSARTFIRYLATTGCVSCMDHEAY